MQHGSQPHVSARLHTYPQSTAKKVATQVASSTRTMPLRGLHFDDCQTQRPARQKGVACLPVPIILQSGDIRIYYGLSIFLSDDPLPTPPTTLPPQSLLTRDRFSKPWESMFYGTTDRPEPRHNGMLSSAAGIAAKGQALSAHSRNCVFRYRAGRCPGKAPVGRWSAREPALEGKKKKNHASEKEGLQNCRLGWILRKRSPH